MYNENQGNNDFKWLSLTFFTAFPTILLFTRNKSKRIEWRNKKRTNQVNPQKNSGVLLASVFFPLDEEFEHTSISQPS